MSDNCIHIVRVHHGDYPDSKRKALEILDWFIQRGLVERDPSDCILSRDELGYRFKPAIVTLFRNWSDAHFGLQTFGLELHYDQRRVFHPFEGAELATACPSCGWKHGPEETGNFVNAWYQASNDFPTCVSCGKATHITSYRFEEDWGFSNLGISLWNTHWELTQEFLEQIRAIYGTPEIRVVHVRI